MIYYIQAFVGLMLGMALMASINIYFFQQKKDITWMNAARAYWVAEIGFYVVGMFGAAVVLFIMSEFIDLNITKEDLRHKESITAKENIQKHFKTVMAFIGMFIQYIAFQVRKRGKTAIDNAVKSVG